jgi:hypothetical protein
MRIIKQANGTYDVIGRDAFNGTDDQYFGNIFLHDDGKYWFQPSEDLAPLRSSRLTCIAGIVKQLNRR